MVIGAVIAGTLVGASLPPVRQGDQDHAWMQDAVRQIRGHATITTVPEMVKPKRKDAGIMLCAYNAYVFVMLDYRIVGDSLPALVKVFSELASQYADWHINGETCWRRLALMAKDQTPFYGPAYDWKQRQFPDIPSNHGAYLALLRAKNLGLISSGDGLFRGARPASIWELMLAGVEAYATLKEMAATGPLGPEFADNARAMTRVFEVFSVEFRSICLDSSAVIDDLQRYAAGQSAEDRQDSRATAQSLR